MPNKTVIRTGARLHFGILSNGQVGGREFGGAGVMLNSPGFDVTFERADEDRIVATEVCRQRVEKIVRSYRTACAGNYTVPSCRIEIRSEIPSHVGLGSGTQLAMAVARGLSSLSEQPVTDARALAAPVTRGKRSAIGLYGFTQGGFLVDAGKSSGDAMAPLIARWDFPADWRFVLVMPTAASGLAGETERDAFARLSPMSEAVTDKLCGLLVRQLLPAVREAEFDACGEAIYEFGRIVGEYFSPVQGGTYGHPAMAALAKHLRSEGIRGCGQTSWGPTLFVLARNQEQARRLVSQLVEDARWSDCRFHIAAPLNTGASVE